MGNVQNIYIINNKKCSKGKVHSFYAKNDCVEQLYNNQVEYNQVFNWKNPEHRNAFHKAGLTLDMFEDSHACVEDHISFICCDECKEIIAIVTHCY
jgi:hypothetical protein